MQQIQLYIEGQRVDMFKDESVTITQSIKNVKDIDKIFTSFSKTFSLPASQTNNKIFKHYYNFDIVGGFDARIKKNNKPHTYKITFFGNTVTLKDTLGDDKLTGLSSLTNLNKTYNAEKVKEYLQEDPSSNAIIVPLITHTQRLNYNSGSSNNEAGNIAYNNGNVSFKVTVLPKNVIL